MAVERIPLARFVTKNQRNDEAIDSTDDGLLRNCIIETNNRETGEFYVKKRPGIGSGGTTDLTMATSSSGNARGMFDYDGWARFAIYGSGFHEDGGTSSFTLSTSSGRCYFYPMQVSGETLIVSDQSNLYYYTNGGSVTRVTDADFPGAHVPGSPVMDGYVFVMETDGTIWHCTQNDPSAWSSNDFVTAESTGDEGRGLIRYRNYIVALGDQTTEFFYNAGNPSGSILNPVQGAASDVGCMSGQTAVHIGNTFLWVGHDREGTCRVYKMNGMQPQAVSTPAIERIITANIDAFKTTAVYANAFSFGGHTYYTINTNDSAIDTLVYDLTENKWYDWSLYISEAHTSIGDQYPYVMYDYDNGVFFQHITDASAYQLNFDSGEDEYSSATKDITMEIITPDVSFNTWQNKIMDRLWILGDEQNGPTILGVSWSDDDGSNWTTPVNIDLSSGLGFLTRLGRFKKRRFKLTNNQSTKPSFRLRDLETDIKQAGYGI